MRVLSDAHGPGETRGDPLFGATTCPMRSWAPPLSPRETAHGCRLSLAGVGHGHGATLQDAADELVSRVLDVALAVRAGGLTYTSGLLPDLDSVAFLHEVAEVAAQGGDIRRLVLSGESTRAA
jgi:hypothetical protein